MNLLNTTPYPQGSKVSDYGTIRVSTHIGNRASRDSQIPNTWVLGPCLRVGRALQQRHQPLTSRRAHAEGSWTPTQTLNLTVQAPVLESLAHASSPLQSCPSTAAAAEMEKMSSAPAFLHQELRQTFARQQPRCPRALMQQRNYRSVQTSTGSESNTIAFEWF